MYKSINLVGYKTTGKVNMGKEQTELMLNIFIKLMGQYYKPISIDKKEYLYTHDFKTKGYEKESWGVGLKLMEHSYIGNQVMNAVEYLLSPEGSWYKTRIVWAGDYAEGEPERELNEQNERPNLYMIMENEGTKLIPPTKSIRRKYKYLVNHTKKIAIDLTTIEKDSNGYRIHPLSLLTAEGNGLGGGDYGGGDSRVGTWARDVISMEKEVPEGYELDDDATFKARSEHDDPYDQMPDINRQREQDWLDQHGYASKKDWEESEGLI